MLEFEAVYTGLPVCSLCLFFETAKLIRYLLCSVLTAYCLLLAVYLPISRAFKAILLVAEIAVTFAS